MNLPGDLEWLILDALVELGINADPAKIAHKLKLLNLDAQGPNGAQPQSSALSKPLEFQPHRCSQFHLGRRASDFNDLAHFSRILSNIRRINGRVHQRIGATSTEMHGIYR